MATDEGLSAAQHMQIAVDDINHARTALDRSQQTCDVESVAEVIERHEEILSDLEETMKTVSVIVSACAEGQE